MIKLSIILLLCFVITDSYSISTLRSSARRLQPSHATPITKPWTEEKIPSRTGELDLQATVVATDRFDEDLYRSDTDDRKQSLSAAIFNLVKANVGSGVFALPAGIAACGDVPSVLGPGAALMCFLGSLAAYSFYMIPRLSRLDSNDSSHPVKSLPEAWEKEVGKDSAWLISLCCLLTPLGTALTFSIVIKDVLGILATSIGLTGAFASRKLLLIGFTTSVLYPLCNLSSLAKLAPISIVGVVGTFLTCIFMAIRALPMSPYFQSGSVFLDSIPTSHQPSFGLIGNNSMSPSILVLISMAATSVLVHFSSHEFCNGLEDSTPKRFKKLTGYGFFFTVLINILVMSAGFLTFGSNSQGLVINNYSPFDIGATISRAIVLISLCGGYPILMKAIKSSFLEIHQKGKQVSTRFTNVLTRGFLAALTAVALFVENAGVVVSLNGAVMGSFIIYLFPSIIYLKATSRLLAEGKIQHTRKLSLERSFNKALIGCGSLIAFFGAMVVLKVI